MEPYLIGETAYNHEGDFDYLIKMIDDMADINLDAIKFHLLFSLSQYLTKAHPISVLLKDWMFSEEQWHQAITYSSEKNLEVIILCDDVKSVEFVNKRFPAIKAIEIHATSINDYFLLKAASQFKGQIILGIGGCSIEEIQYAVSLLYSLGKTDLLLMYGFQSYPTNLSDINMAKLLKIKEMFELPVGYADHTAYNDERNIAMSAMGAALGIPVLEKHYTPDYGVERIDYFSAVGRSQMIEIRDRMKMYLSAYGNGHLDMSEPELKYGNVGPMKKALVAKHSIAAGEEITLENVWFKRTEKESYIRQNQLMSLIGSKATRQIAEDENIDYSNVSYVFKEADMAVIKGNFNKKD
jgi:sialic acid synthase SpsE